MRIGINIPNELVKRLGPFKQFVNISQVCRDAIYQYVALQERAQKLADSDGVDKLATELFEEKRTTEVDWELFGLQDAKDWASLATGDDWDRIFYLLDYFEEQGKSPFDHDGRLPIPRLKGVKHYYDRQYEVDVEDGWFQQHMYDEANPYIMAQSEYQRGFLAYIMIIRQKIREKLTADIREQQEKIKQMKSELKSNVEIPDGLNY
ncbi:hypothetical protein ACFLTS_01490 [Chloroflexota bacterium]